MRNLFINFILIANLIFCNACKNEKSHNSCGEVSVRVLQSMLREKYEIFENKIKSNYSKELLSYLNDYRNIGFELIDANGGYKGGKSLELLNPCNNGNKVQIIFEEFDIRKLNKQFVLKLTEANIINKKVENNLKFIVDSFFEFDNAIFNKKTVNKERIGYLTVEYMVFQLTLFDLIQ